MLGQLPTLSIGGGSKPSSTFEKFAGQTSRITGKPATFLLATAIVIAWGVTGPYFQYSDTWQLVINTGTTIVTFLMVFLIQNTQNRDTVALQLKLDELILATRQAPNEVIAIEEASEQEIEKEKRKVKQRAKLSRGGVTDD